MLENLLKLVKENAGDAIINNPAVPNQQNDAVIETTTSSIFETLKTQLSANNITDFVNLFKNNSSLTGNESLLKNVNADVVKNLMTKIGIENAAATGIASSLIPTVLNKLVNKTNDPNDSSFDIKDIVTSLGANNSTFTGIVDMLDGQKNGTTDIGGIFNTVKGMFGK